MQLDVELRRFSQGCLDATYLGNLATDVEVDESQAVAHTFLVEQLQGFQQLCTGQPEL